MTCECVLHHFLEGKDKGLYLAPDKIVDTEVSAGPGGCIPDHIKRVRLVSLYCEGHSSPARTPQQQVDIQTPNPAVSICPLTLNPPLQVMPLQGPTDLCPVLACRDRALRILDCSSTALLFEVPLPSPPTTLLYTTDTHDPLHKFPAGSKQLLVGCEDGRVIQLMLDASAVRQGFTISSPGAGAVQALYCGSDYSKVSVPCILASTNMQSHAPWICSARKRVEPQQLPTAYDRALVERPVAFLVADPWNEKIPDTSLSHHAADRVLRHRDWS